MGFAWGGKARLGWEDLPRWGRQAHWVSQAGGNIRDRRGGSFSLKKLIQKLITRRGANSHPPQKKIVRNGRCLPPGTGRE